MIASFTPFPVLETERLILRQPAPADDEDNYNLRTNERVNLYLSGYSHSSIDETKAWLQRIMKNIAGNELVFWMMTLKESGTFIGTICLWNLDAIVNKAEVGYTLLPAYHRQGYMHEALKIVLHYGFNTMQLDMIEAYTNKDNEPSIGLLLKNHFRQDSTRTPTIEHKRVFILNR